jgi:hypothetical protein
MFSHMLFENISTELVIHLHYVNSVHPFRINIKEEVFQTFYGNRHATKLLNVAMVRNV